VILATVPLLIASGLFGLVTPAAAAPTCPVLPAAAIIVDTPWPQRQLDYARLSQITDGAGVTVAVVDSGVDAGNPQLRDAVVRGSDVLNPGQDGRMDCVGHGTAVASIIAGRSVSGVAMRGLAPGASILPIRASERVEDDAGTVTGAGTTADLVAGIRAAVDARPRPGVLNISASTPIDDPDLRAAIAAALAADIVVVASVGNAHNAGPVGNAHNAGPVGNAGNAGPVGNAGNAGPAGNVDSASDVGNDRAAYPAAYDGVLGVGGVGSSLVRVPTSQMGTYVDLVAPGDEVTVSAVGSGHRVMRGTSVAAPFVSAAAALVRARFPSLTQAQVVERLTATADPVPGPRPSAEYGYGLVNPLRALTEVVTPHSQAVAPRVTLGEPTAAQTGRDPGHLAIGTAVALSVLALVVAAVAAAIPAGRRHRWQPTSARSRRT
jgi:type VII secretion-associated serine protease mycosin